MSGIWRASTAIGAERSARVRRVLATVSMVMVTLAAPVAVLAIFSGEGSAATPPGSVGKAVAAVSPSWSSDWADSSFCTSKYDSPYMGVTFDGVAVCGTTSNASGTSNEQGGITYNGVTLDSVGFQCVELAARYLYYTTGDVPPQVNGDDFATAVHNEYNSIPVYPNGTAGQPYAPGDIVSFTGNAGTPVAGIGHVAVVTASTENSSGNGTVTIMEENAAKSPQETLEVDDWSLQPGAGEWVTPYDFDALATGLPTSYEVAFQANTGSLYTYSPFAGTINLNLGMMASTSPSTAAVSGGYEIAFQSNTGSLYAVGAAGSNNLGLGVMTGTSPSIAAGAGGYEIAFQANTGSLYTYSPSAGAVNLNLGVLAGTSPSIAAVPGGYEIAFQANTGSLYAVGAAGSSNLNLGVMAGTSPSIAAYRAATRSPSRPTREAFTPSARRAAAT